MIGDPTGKNTPGRRFRRMRSRGTPPPTPTRSSKPRPGQDRGSSSILPDGCPRRRRPDQARCHAHRRAHAGARRFRKRTRATTDRDPRVSLSPGTGLRLGCAQSRHGARRHRPEIQSADGPRAPETIRAKATGHPHDAALEGLDGVQKMSKSLNNYVGIDEPPAEIFGKLCRFGRAHVATSSSCHSRRCRRSKAGSATSRRAPIRRRQGAFRTGDRGTLPWPCRV